ncbi:hypothetical protein [Streptomyces xanthophaeus]|uniref:bpX5 domain-containing protein n=1 Tax=Streptomyces xanthophaeus TaxID=67385 RepID=UPI002647F575|nr:hypothetical protein [Streptomyces xanthophaeus]WKD31816.1 hypothetical protein KO717_07525 [Streptomyces xanthophaeus]
MTAAQPSPTAPATAPAPSFPLRWERREPPLPAAAVLAVGDAVPGLAAAALERVRGGARLGVLADDGPGLPAADRALLVLGDEADLPWADGARYLGRDAGLLVPTTARPAPAAPLWRRAVGAAEGQLCVLVPGRALVADVPAPVTSPDALDAFTRPAGAGPDGPGSAPPPRGPAASPGSARR